MGVVNKTNDSKASTAMKVGGDITLQDSFEFRVVLLDLTTLKEPSLYYYT